jgi:transcriptional regulator with XRE-family HTH domain
MVSNSIWGAYIAAYRKSNRLTQEQLAERLNVTPQTISRWESGKQEPDIVSQGALRQVVKPSFAATRLSWIYRVDHSNAYEILIDQNEAIIAISDKVRAYWRLPHSDYINHHVQDFVPGGRDCGSREFARFGIADMASVGLFSGGVRHILISVDYWRDGVCQGRVYDIWPVTTADGDALAHLVGTEAPPSLGPPQPDGFYVRRCEMVLMNQ